MSRPHTWLRHRAAAWCLAPLVFVGAVPWATGRAADQREASPVQDAGVPTAKRALDLKDYYRLETVGSPAMAPDGRSVAFVRTVIVETENRRHTEIWLVPADGSAAPMRLTHPAFSSTAPRWSPDGRLLAFSSRRKVPGRETDKASSIWFLRMDQPGGEAFQIPGVDGMPIFSPDNNWIAFTKKTPSEATPARRHASDFERLIHERFKGQIYDWMNFRFDGRGYLPDPRDPEATPPEELYLVARSGGTPRHLTSLRVDVQSAVWRPDSRTLALVANAHQRDEHTYERSDLWIVTTEGQIRRLTDDGFDHDAPAWSPDGRLLAFRRQQGLSLLIQAKQSHGAPVDLYRTPADGGPMDNLTAGWDLLPGAPQWSPDGRFIYFSSGIGGSTHVFRLPSSGGAVEQVTRGERSLGGFSVSSKADRMTYTATDSTHPAELFSARLDGAEERQLTTVHHAVTSEVDFASAERIRYPSKDGTPIEGWLIRPLGYDRAKGPCPLIVSIHGGPHGAYGPEFSFQFQLWAAQGYVVLYTNPRGSTGYGEKFLWATWGGWGILDYDDVMAGVDAVMKREAIDERRIGVTGYSYGGFLTNWIITQTPRFAAAISGAGISNWTSDYGTADIPRTKESEFFGPPWESKSGDLLRKLSPITHAGRATTPTLFIHGESDFRVPIEQGEQMYTALKKRRVAATFVRYPETSHGGWTPWNTVHRYYQELAWWNQYLSAPRATTR